MMVNAAEPPGRRLSTPSAPGATRLRGRWRVGKREALEEPLPLVDDAPPILGVVVHRKVAENFEVGAAAVEHDRLRLYRRLSS